MTGAAAPSSASDAVVASNGSGESWNNTTSAEALDPVRSPDGAHGVDPGNCAMDECPVAAGDAVGPSSFDRPMEASVSDCKDGRSGGGGGDDDDDNDDKNNDDSNSEGNFYDEAPINGGDDKYGHDVEKNVYSPSIVGDAPTNTRRAASTTAAFSLRRGHTRFNSLYLRRSNPEYVKGRNDAAAVLSSDLADVESLMLLECPVTFDDPDYGNGDDEEGVRVAGAARATRAARAGSGAASGTRDVYLGAAANVIAEGTEEEEAASDDGLEEFVLAGGVVGGEGGHAGPKHHGHGDGHAGKNRRHRRCRFPCLFQRIELLRRTCLRPELSLRAQMMLSFGLISACTVLFVMGVSVVMIVLAGRRIETHAESKLKQSARLGSARTARYVAEALRLVILPDDAAAILSEAVRDRFVGYGDYDDGEAEEGDVVGSGYVDDLYVPFKDTDTGNNVYPLDVDVELPLDWQIRRGTGASARAAVSEVAEEAATVASASASASASTSTSTSTSASASTVTAPERDAFDTNDTDEDTAAYESFVVANVNRSSHQEHLQGRFGWYGGGDNGEGDVLVSTLSAMFHTKGLLSPYSLSSSNSSTSSSCDPHASSYSGCPTDLSPPEVVLRRKAKDLNPVLKSLYEYTVSARQLGVAFVNGGAGASVVFPHRPLDRTAHDTASTAAGSSSASYDGIGCDWLVNSTHPYNSPRSVGTATERSVGTATERSRCRSAGTGLSNAGYNPLEREWFRDTALRPDRPVVTGPYRDAWGSSSSSSSSSPSSSFFRTGTRSDDWIMTVGRAAYDRLNRNLIGCAFVDVPLNWIAGVIGSIDVFSSDSILISLIRWDDVGTVVTSPHWNSTVANRIVTVNDPDLGIPGLNLASFSKFKDSIDFESGVEWSAAAVYESFESASYRFGGWFVSAHPLPALPDDYDPTYRPEFMVVVSTEESDAFRSFYDLNDLVRDHVRELVILTIVVGISGVAVVIIIIFCVSMALTEPLKWMERVAGEIVSDFGNVKANSAPDEGEEGKGDGNKLQEKRRYSIDGGGGDDKSKGKGKDAGGTIDVDVRKTFRFTPRTELSDLLDEFCTLVSKFSGDGMAAESVRMAAGRRSLSEVRNRFTQTDQFPHLAKAFTPLYMSRRRPESNFRFDYGSGGTGDSASDGLNVVCRHYGRNIRSLKGSAGSTSSSFAKGAAANAEDVSGGCTDDEAISDRARVVRSPLFRWIAILIVTPLLATTVTISAVVSWDISTSFTRLDTAVQNEYLELEVRTMSLAAALLALQASWVTERAVRDLHVLRRVAGWLLFGGVRRSDSFAEMMTAAQRCRLAPEGKNSCDFIKEVPCDCAWKDQAVGDLCSDYGDGVDTRHLQRAFWAGQSQDAWPNGDRNYTSFPLVDGSPAETAFWDDPNGLPGSERGALAGGYGTTYDRLRTISALSVVQMPLYNYDLGRNKPMGNYIGFEADGMLVGIGGCNRGHADYAFFRSSESNGAAELRPELCPLGKYGYDARCRDWYHAGKRLSETGNGTVSPLYITPPYTFPNGLVAQSCSLALVDPYSGVHVGQALVDFVPDSIFEALRSTNAALGDSGFPFIITPQEDVLGTDTVIGPGFNIGDPGKSIKALVLPNEMGCESDSCRDRARGFDEISSAMQAGNSGTGTFSRTSAEGKLQKMHISYAPIKCTVFRPVDDTDFARGTITDSAFIYSLALTQLESEVLEPFRAVKDDINLQVNICIGLLAMAIVIAAALLLYISFRVTESIIVPILNLLANVRSVSRLNNRDIVLPRAQNAMSREVVAICDTFSMLFKVVRFANTAFFTGDIGKAYCVLVDALRLFKSLDNKKAIGVASNNLGNCMLAMYRIMEASRETRICGLTKADIISRGTAYFNIAIKLGEDAYDKFYEEEGWSGNCLVFMQHLSNRYFNRAIFFLTVKKDHKQPDICGRLGFRDLDIVMDMDVEVASQCLEVGFTVDKVEHFELSLSRIRGFLSLMELSYDDDWNLPELILGAYNELTAALRNPTSELFRDVSPAGRMQQLDWELIMYAQLSNRDEDAARAGIRMLIEDEYVLYDAQCSAVRALVNYAQSEDRRHEISVVAKEELYALSAELQTNVLEALWRRISSAHGEVERRISASLRNSSIRASAASTAASQISLSLRETIRGDFTMEAF